MPLLVRMGAMLSCSFGVTPSPLTVVDPTCLMEDATPAANIMDHIPFTNIMPFGMCSSISNPAVASATAAAAGVLTPMPCTPVTSSPWVPGSPMATVRSMPALNQTCQCLCAFGGVIAINVPGATKTLD